MEQMMAGEGMDERSWHRLARIQQQLQPSGSSLCSPGQLESMPTLSIGLPALDMSSAFPQATPASIFPPSVSDFYKLDDLLSPEDIALRNRVRKVMETHICLVGT